MEQSSRHIKYAIQGKEDGTYLDKEGYTVLSLEQAEKYPSIIVANRYATKFREFEDELSVVKVFVTYYMEEL